MTYIIVTEEIRQPPSDSDKTITPKEEQTEETPVQPMDPVSDDEDDSDENPPESNHEENDDKAVAGDNTDTNAASVDHEKNLSDENPSPQGAGALPSIDTAPDEVAEEAKEKETLGDKKSEPTPIPNSLNLVSILYFLILM